MLCSIPQVQLSLSLPETHSWSPHHQLYAPFAHLDNSHTSLGPPALYLMQNLHYPIYGTSQVNRLCYPHVHLFSIPLYSHAQSTYHMFILFCHTIILSFHVFLLLHHHNIQHLCSINHGNTEVDNVPWHMGAVDFTNDLQCANHWDRETMFLVAWMHRWSLMCLKHSGGMDSVDLPAYIGVWKSRSSRQPNIFEPIRNSRGALNWDWKWTFSQITFLSIDVVNVQVQPDIWLTCILLGSILCTKNDNIAGGTRYLVGNVSSQNEPKNMFFW